MTGFLSAHGYDPGPTQRPWLAGAITGALATVPAVGLLYALGALQVEARILGLSIWTTIGAGALVMAAAGSLYARLFGRAANDASAGWLFGMAYGFALWAGGSVYVLPLASGGLVPGGLPAAGVFLSLVLWGGTLGALLPFVHRPLRGNIEDAARAMERGPMAATTPRPAQTRS